MWAMDVAILFLILTFKVMMTILAFDNALRIILSSF